MAAFLEVEALSAAYAERVVLADISFALEAGEVLGVVGESGAGKTSLARVLSGQLEPSAGILRLDGGALPLRRSREQRRIIQLVPQDPYASLNPRMTVRQVLSELLTVHRLAAGSGLEARCLELVEEVRLPRAALDAYPSQFSGGQRQRIAIARALAVEPRLLVADEITSSLDVSVQATVLDLLSDLRRELGLGIILVSHDLAVVHRLCDRVAVLRRGEMVELSKAEDFFVHPRQPYSRELLASTPRLRRLPS